MEVTKIEATPLEVITVAGEKVPVEGTGEATYEVEVDGVKEISTKGHFERCVEYWENKKLEEIAKCDCEITKYKEVLAEVAKVEGK